MFLSPIAAGQVWIKCSQDDSKSEECLGHLPILCIYRVATSKHLLLPPSLWWQPASHRVDRAHLSPMLTARVCRSEQIVGSANNLHNRLPHAFLLFGPCRYRPSIGKT